MWYSFLHRCSVVTHYSGVRGYGEKSHFQQYFSYIVVVSFTVGGNLGIWTLVVEIPTTIRLLSLRLPYLSECWQRKSVDILPKALNTIHSTTKKYILPKALNTIHSTTKKSPQNWMKNKNSIYLWNKWNFGNFLGLFYIAF